MLGDLARYVLQIEPLSTTLDEHGLPFLPDRAFYWR
jgi:hypothetical protein